MQTISRPEASEYPVYFDTYIKLVEGNDLISALKAGQMEMTTYWSAIPEDKLSYSYAPGKWTIKEIIGHLIEAERVFAYRALRFSRNDETPLASFDEDKYVIASNARERNFLDLLGEYNTVRASSIALWSGVTIDMAMRSGIANDKRMSVRALGYCIAGHEIHHQRVISERYGVVI